MRLGIRAQINRHPDARGAFPFLAISLIVMLGGGAAIQLNSIRGRFEDTADASRRRNFRCACSTKKSKSWS